VSAREGTRKPQRSSTGERPRRASRRSGASRRSKPASILFITLLALPAWACARLSDHVSWRLLLVYAAGISAITFYVYRRDKELAVSGGWRTPESTLHLLELLGGWPGAFLAQRLFHHKTAKRRFQVIFWIIVALHQWVSFDLTQDWRFGRRLLSVMQGSPARGWRGTR
jgi:uncharacterized membrane protein YsdA (DUF1294 family)